MFLFTLYSHIHFQRTVIKHITALCRRCHNVMSETQLPFLIILFTHFKRKIFDGKNLSPTSRLNGPIVEIKSSFHFLAIIVTDPRHYNVIILCNIDCNYEEVRSQVSNLW